MDRRSLTAVDGGIETVAGVRAGATAAGLKASGRPDLGLVVTDGPATAAVVTTTNRVRAACCDVCVEHAADGRARAVVVNAGNANACTPRGREDALATCDEVAALVGCAPSDVLPMSTGIIGVPLPLDRVLTGLPRALADATRDGGRRVAEAMLTTDLTVKQAAHRVTDEHGTCTVAGIAKGSGMIEPALATMLAIVVTDAAVPSQVLRTLLRRAAGRTFNRISVDASGSTNDTVALLATAAVRPGPGLNAFQAGLEAVCADLAAAIVADGEGVTRVARITVAGARSEGDAETLARAVAASALFRAALHGGDPNWGRILAAMGGAGVDFDPSRVAVACGGVTVCRFGVAASYDVARAAAAMSQPRVDIGIHLGQGDHAVTFLAGDLSRDYVTINADYHT